METDRPLRGLKPAPPAPELRSRVLAAARVARETRSASSEAPLRWRLALAAALLAYVALAAGGRTLGESLRSRWGLESSESTEGRIALASARLAGAGE